jgi:signal transduction histidine kinase
MDALHLSLVSAACAALAALVALRVRAAPTMGDQGWLAAVAATGAAELLLNAITYDPASTDPMVVWATRGQVALIFAHLAAWSAYSCAFMGLPLRRDAAVIPALLAAGAFSFLPGAVITDQVSARPFSSLGTIYRDPRPAALGWFVFAIAVLQAARIALRFFRAWRAQVPWAGAHAAAIGIAAALGANDALVILGVYPGPYLIDLGFAVPAAILLVATGGRVVDLARALDALRDGLEAQVAARTAELVAAERRVRDAQQLALLGQMTSGVAHELNNPISAAVASLRSVSESLAQRHPGSGLAGDLNEASVALLRVQGLAARLRNASILASTDGPPSPVGLAVTVRTALEIAAPKLASADVTVDVEPGTVALAMEPMVLQILRDLLVNAAEARGERPRVRVSVRARTEGDRVRLEVEDDGTGMDAATLARTAELTFSTRKGGVRSGLGLAFARSLARGVGGELELRSEPGRGTVATLELPAAAPQGT